MYSAVAAKVYGTLHLGDGGLVVDLYAKPTTIDKIRTKIIELLTIGSIRWEWIDDD